MKQSSLIVEFLIIGFLLAIALAELYAIFFHVSSFEFARQVKDYKEVFILACTIIVYILGAIFHRTSRIISYDRFAQLAALIGIKYPLKTLIYKEKYAKVYQNGSSGVIEKISYNESLLRIYKATFLILPVIGTLTWVWWARMQMSNQGIFIFCCCICLSVLSFVAHKMQAIDFSNFIESIYQVIDKA
jgi:predicted membrane-bound spermidine synthase